MPVMFGGVVGYLSLAMRIFCLGGLAFPGKIGGSGRRTRMFSSSRHRGGSARLVVASFLVVIFFLGVLRSLVAGRVGFCVLLGWKLLRSMPFAGIEED